MFGWNFGGGGEQPQAQDNAQAQAQGTEGLEDLDLDELKRKAHGGKSQRTKAKKALENALKQLDRSPSNIEANNVKEQASRMRYWDNRLHRIYQLMLDEVAGVPEHLNDEREAELGIDKIDSEWDPLRRWMSESLKNFGEGGGPAAVAPRQDGNNAPRYKPDSSLKPKELTDDATPEEVKQWQLKMKGYFYTTGIDTLPAIGQSTHARASLSEALLFRIRDKVHDDLRVFADPANPNANCWMKVIDKEFEEIFPVFDRRYKLARIKQEKNEPFMAFAKRARDARTQAHMDEGISGDEFLALIFLMGINDDDLRKKFLEEENPTAADMERIGRAHDRTVKGVDKSPPINSSGTVQKIGPGGNGGNGGQRNGRNGQTAGNQVNKGKLSQIVQEALKMRSDLNGKCLTCGAGGHSRHECPKKGNVTCGKCGNKHDSSVCLKQQLDAIKAKKSGNAGTVQQVQESKPYHEDGNARPEGPFTSIAAGMIGRINKIYARQEVGEVERAEEYAPDFELIGENARAQQPAISPAPETDVEVAWEMPTREVAGATRNADVAATPITVRDPGVAKASVRAAKARVKGPSQDTPTLPL